MPRKVKSKYISTIFNCFVKWWHFYKLVSLKKNKIRAFSMNRLKKIFFFRITNLILTFLKQLYLVYIILIRLFHYFC